MKLSVFGSIAYDELARFEGSFQEVIGAQDLKNLSVSFVVNDRKRYFGGVAGNIAYGLQLLDTPVSICGAVGEDAADYLDRMKEWGADRSNVQVLEGNTPLAFITSDTEENQIAHFAPGVIGEGSPAPQIPASDYLLVGAENKARMLAALDAEAKIIFDPGQMIHTFTHEERIEALSKCEMLIVNSYEWELLKEEQEHAPAIVIITRGGEGVSLIQNGEMQEFACDAVEALDPTGAGDAFRAGFLTGLMNKESLEQCIALGQKMGRACVQTQGTQNYSLNS